MFVEFKRPFSIYAFRTALEYHWNEHFTFAGEAHDFWEIVYVISGTVEVTEDERIYRLTTGNMVLHAPMEFHKIRSVEGTAPHVLIMTFFHTGELPASLKEGVFSLSVEEQEEYEAIFRRIYSFYHKEDTGEYAGQECADGLSAFLIRLSHSHSAKEVLVHTRDALLYHKLIQVMTHHLYENLSLEEIAANLPISISYMKVLFRRYAGIGPKSYYSHLRCKEAIKLLQTGLSAAEISGIMNFSSPSYFSVFFKKMTGVPPAAYIRQTASQPMQSLNSFGASPTCLLKQLEK